MKIKRFRPRGFRGVQNRKAVFLAGKKGFSSAGLRLGRVGRAVLFPSVWFRWTFGTVSLAAVACVFLFRLYGTLAADLSFPASALGLYYLITVTAVPLVRRIRARLLLSPYFRRSREDPAFSARLSLYRGMAVNILYAAFKLVTGIRFRSEWLIAIAVYYGILILLKYTLIRQDLRFLRMDNNPDLLTEWKTCRRVGWLMLLLNVGLSGITVQVISRNRSYAYPGSAIFAMAAYSFYRIIIAVIRAMRSRHRLGPIFSAARIIDVSFAVTAMFTLQTAMFASFAGGADVRIPNFITGTAVALIVTAIAVSMIIRSSVRIRQLSSEGEAGSPPPGNG